MEDELPVVPPVIAAVLPARRCTPFRLMFGSENWRGGRIGYMLCISQYFRYRRIDIGSVLSKMVGYPDEDPRLCVLRLRLSCGSLRIV